MSDQEMERRLEKRRMRRHVKYTVHLARERLCLRYDLSSLFESKLVLARPDLTVSPETAWTVHAHALAKQPRWVKLDLINKVIEEVIEQPPNAKLSPSAVRSILDKISLKYG